MARKRLSQLFCILLSVLLCGCGHVKNPKQLLRTARASHGSCTLVSKTEDPDKTTIVVRDKKQGFTYTLTSRMQDINIDGSSFGSFQQTSDSFDESLIGYVISETKTDLDAVCQKYNATYESRSVFDLVMSIKLHGDSSFDDAKAVAEECAAIIAPYNIKDRLNYKEIRVDHEDDTHFGSIRFPDLTFRDPEREKEDIYDDIALTYDPDAVFVRKETKTFADTSLPLDRVSGSDESNSPKSNTDPVTFYYYEVEGEEFYVCDFLDRQTGTFYNNYNDAISPKRKSRVHFSFHLGK